MLVPKMWSAQEARTFLSFIFDAMDEYQRKIPRNEFSCKLERCESLLADEKE